MKNLDVAFIDFDCVKVNTNIFALNIGYLVFSNNEFISTSPHIFPLLIYEFVYQPSDPVARSVSVRRSRTE